MNNSKLDFVQHFSNIYDEWLTLYHKTDNHVDHSALIHQMSHEIKNPLTLIKSTLQLIEVQTPAVKSNKHWHSLFDEIDYIDTLLNNFKSYNTNSNLKQKISIDNLITTIADYFDSLACKNNIDFFVSHPANLPLIYGDETKLKEAFMNLIKNAFEATEASGTVSVIIKNINNLVVIAINDTGCGIPTDKIDSIFEPFITYKEDGTGLGLSIVKSIINNHGGTINVTSKYNVGTSFVISLPVVTN